MCCSGPAMQRRHFVICVKLATVTGSSLILAPSSAIAQQHQHPLQDQTIHERFYSTWMMPDNRRVPCCNNQDCSPAESKIENGSWVARKVGDHGKWTVIPPVKIEHDRVSPDGRSHLCSRQITRYSKLGLGDVVLCFIPGAGF